MYRYSLDQVGEMEWVLFDRENRKTPTTYFIFLVKLGSGVFNYQLILTSYDAAAAGSQSYPVFKDELFSTFFYSIAEGVSDFVVNVHYALQGLDIEDPVELPSYLGGTVRSRIIHTPSIHRSN